MYIQNRLFLCHDTALIGIRHLRGFYGYSQPIRPCQVKLSDRDIPNLRDEHIRNQIAIPFLYGASKRHIHTLVSSPKSRRHSSELICHTCKHLPSFSFCKFDDNVFLSSPELCFLQMGESLSLPHLIALGCELCGSYSLDGESDRGFFECPPITSQVKIKHYIEKASNIRGRTRALRALQYVADGSASPMETILYMLLSLPPLLGGYGIPKPHINFEIKLNDEGRKTLLQSDCRCDLFWPQYRLAVEYDSNAYHSDRTDIARDSNRRAALKLSGITVITATNQQIRNHNQTEGLAKSIARYMHLSIRGRFAYDSNKAMLRRQLFHM